MSAVVATVASSSDCGVGDTGRALTFTFSSGATSTSLSSGVSTLRPVKACFLFCAMTADTMVSSTPTKDTSRAPKRIQYHFRPDNSV